MLLGTLDISGQAQQDSLYNTFQLTIKKIGEPVSRCGLGIPDYLTKEEVLNAIHDAFKASGIILTGNYWYETEDVNVILDGYNKNEKIGFLLIEHNKKGKSFFYSKNNHSKQYDSSIVDWQSDITNKIKQFEKKRGEAFLLFLEDKTAYHKELKRQRTTAGKKFAEKIKYLERFPEIKPLFENYFLQYKLDQVLPFPKQNGLRYDLKRHVNNRLENSTEKLAILQSTYRMFSSVIQPTAFSEKINAIFENLHTINADEKFIEQYMILNTFLNYNSNWAPMNQVPAYNELKLEIMNTYSIEYWLNHVHTLDQFKERYLLQFEETNRILENNLSSDQSNNTNTNFILPLEMRENRLAIWLSPNSKEYIALQNEYKLLNEKRDSLSKEFETKSMVKYTAGKEKDKEIKKLFRQHTDKQYLPKTEIDSIKTLIFDEEQVILKKYKDMNLMSDEEEILFKQNLKATYDAIHAKRKTESAYIKEATINRLKEDVKMYIQWARSKM